MRDDRQKQDEEGLFRIGTPECAVLFAMAAMVLALLFLTVGFWHMLWIALLMLAAAFLGGVRNKKQWIKDVINRIVPAKQVVPYRTQNEEISKALRAARAAQQDGPAAEEQPAKDDGDRD